MGNQGSNQGGRNREPADEEAPCSPLGSVLKVVAFWVLGAWILTSPVSEELKLVWVVILLVQTIRIFRTSSTTHDPDGRGNRAEYDRALDGGQVEGYYGSPRDPRPNSYHLGKAIIVNESEVGRLGSGGGGGGGGCGREDSVMHAGYRHRHDPRPDYHYLGNADQNHCLKMIKFMSYNVWSRHDVEVHERMKAIGHLIEQHRPHVIFFQEVTPLIYSIFQKFAWWNAYKYSVSPEKASGESFCNMLLSKFPVKESGRMSLENSATSGRKLCWAAVEVAMGKELVVATAHLKRPNPPSETHSIERVAQAENALGFLDGFPNVVFGGDMNWDEDSDGPFPQLPGWVDAWENLRPGQKGWTFDTNSNPMLKDHRPLQKRLDRFLCKLRDFDLVRVDMIGTEAIPGLWCKIIRTMVPVLPSDHYGLLLTVSY